jgi:hypothetical protein
LQHLGAESVELLDELLREFLVSVLHFGLLGEETRSLSHLHYRSVNAWPRAVNGRTGNATSFHAAAAWASLNLPWQQMTAETPSARAATEPMLPEGLHWIL